MDQPWLKWTVIYGEGRFQCLLLCAGCHSASCQYWDGCFELCTKTIWKGMFLAFINWIVSINVAVYICFFMQVSLATDFMYNYMSRDVTASFGYDYILRQVISYCLLSHGCACLGNHSFWGHLKYMTLQYILHCNVYI